MAATTDTTLPKSHFQTYLSYKASTRRFIEWLRSASNITRQKSDSSTVAVVEMTKAIKNNRTTFPLDIQIALQDAITGRKKLTKFYESLDVQDIPKNKNHRNYTDTLQTSLDQLSPLVPYFGKTSKPQPGKSSNSESQGLQSSRNFEILLTLPEETSPEVTDSGGRTDQYSWNDWEPVVRDDGIAKEFEIMRILMDLELALGQIRDIWSMVALGLTTSVVAAAFSSAVYSLASEPLQELENLGLSNETDLVIAKLQLFHTEVVAMAVEASSTTDIDTGTGMVDLIAAFEAIEHSAGEEVFGTESVEQVNGLTAAEAFRNGEASSLHYFLRLIENANDRPDEFLQEDHMAITSTAWLNRSAEQPKNWNKALSLAILAAVMRGYYAPPDTTSNSTGQSQPPDLGVMVSKFSEEVLAEIRLSLEVARIRETYEPGDWDDMANTIANLERNGSDFEQMKEPWQLGEYPRNPYVLGARAGLISEFIQQWTNIADTYTSGVSGVFIWGIHLPDVLHIYNVMVQVQDITPIPLLDSMCELYKIAIFNGERPKRNFTSSYGRQTGGRLALSRDIGSDVQTFGSNTTNRLRAPTDAEYIDEINRRISKRPRTLIETIFKNVSSLSRPDLYKDIHQKVKAIRKNIRKGQPDNLPSLFEMKIGSIRRSLLAETTQTSGFLPVLTLNHLAFWRTCIVLYHNACHDTVDRQTAHQQYHRENKPDTCGQDCTCMAIALMRYGDAYSEGTPERDSVVLYNYRRDWKEKFDSLAQWPLAVTQCQWQHLR